MTAGCVQGAAFVCERDDQCAGPADAGRCEASGYCSFPDPQCAGGHRYGDHAGALSGQCAEDLTPEPGCPDCDAGARPDGGGEATCGASGQACCDQQACDAGLGCVGGVCSCVTQVSVGGDHACARQGDGRLMCWGAVLGAALEGIQTDLGAPSQVPGLPAVQSARVGDFHACALGAAGDVWCWGAASRGLLGNGPADGLLGPAPVEGVVAAALDVGERHSCASTATGLSCWGWNDARQAGIAGGVDVLSPTVVEGIAGIDSFALGGDHSCVDAAGGVVCWGKDTDGQLGGPAESPLGPTPQPQLDDARQLAVAGHRSCLLRTDGTVACMGDNHYGQLGDGTTEDSSALVEVTDVSGIEELVAGVWHTCARSGDGVVSCWGRNDVGQLGDGTVVQRERPVRVKLDEPVLALAAGWRTTCAIGASGTVWCWGQDLLDTGGTGAVLTPVAVPLSCGP